MKRKASYLLLALLLVGCQLFSPGTVKESALPSTATATAPAQITQEYSTATAEPEDTSAPEAASTATIAPVAQDPSVIVSDRNPFEVDTARPFADIQAAKWNAQPYGEELSSLPVNLDQTVNPSVIEKLTEDQIAFLAQNGFVVLDAGDRQFEDIRFETSKKLGQPYYLTTDSAYHSFHLVFDELLKAVERDYLSAQIQEISVRLLEKVQEYQTEVKGTVLEEDARLSAGYLAVALKLFSPGISISPELEALAAPQVEQILAGAGQQVSVLIPDFKDDYSAYQPVGHYTSSPELENYFRGMTWYGRVSFLLKNPQDASYQPSRAPLILTLALDEARINENQTAGVAWGDIHELLTFLVGPSDDPGPIELAALMDAVYGTEISIHDLADEAKWQTFKQAVEQLPAPQINSTFLESTAALEATRDWRFMGQRFTLDASIFQNLVFDRVGTQSNPRKLPTGLDVMAVFGSQAALEALTQAGETEYANYMEQFHKLQQAVQDQPEREWQNRFYSAWLYTFFPQVEPKGAEYPPYMNTEAWGYKDLNTALGSWAELKHDTVLYSKMPEFLGGGGPPGSGPAPAYVEPNPEVFYRLDYMADVLHDGFTLRNIGQDLVEDIDGPLSLRVLLNSIDFMGSRFKMYGDIAARELAGDALTEDDFWIITQCIGILECEENLMPPPPPVPVISAVAGAEENLLEVGVGHPHRIFVVVPINGELQIAQGGVFSYYEFTQLRTERLTDDEWRERLETGEPQRPEWTNRFFLPGGETNPVTAFRVNDVYIITKAGGNPPLNVRELPSKSGAVIHHLNTGDFITITEGPVQADGITWWKIHDEFTGKTGWVAEDQAWYERAYGQFPEE